MKESFLLQLDDGSGELAFEWDSDKDSANLKKHGIRFSEAATIFQADVLTVEDPGGYGELREISFGRLGGAADGSVVICVAHTDRLGKTRIISARKATPHERKHFDVYYRKTHH
jgi:uncharacterized DUF497 family protein